MKIFRGIVQGLPFISSKYFSPARFYQKSRRKFRKNCWKSNTIPRGMARQKKSSPKQNQRYHILTTRRRRRERTSEREETKIQFRFFINESLIFPFLKSLNSRDVLRPEHNQTIIRKLLRWRFEVIASRHERHSAKRHDTRSETKREKLKLWKMVSREMIDTRSNNEKLMFIWVTHCWDAWNASTRLMPLVSS